MVVAACLSVFASPVDGSSTDQAISAIKLTLKRFHSGTETLAFVSKDPAYFFSFVGRANDPSAGIPGGARIELCSSGPTSVGFDMPIGNGTLGWTGKNGGTSGVFRFVNAPPPNAFSGMKAMTMKRNFLKQRTSGEGGSPSCGKRQ